MQVLFFQDSLWHIMSSLTFFLLKTLESKVLNVGHHVLDKNFCNPKKTQDTVLGLFGLNLRALLSTSRPVECINSCFPAELLLQKT